MTLPTQHRIKHEDKLEGLEGKLLFTPFTVADRRNLLAALSFEDPRAFIRTVVDIVERLSNLKTLDPDLRLHYVEAAFIKIYAASSGGVVEATFTCNEMVAVKGEDGNDDGERLCGTETDIRIPINDVTIEFGPLPATASQVIRLQGVKDGFIELVVPGWEAVSEMIDKDSSLDFGDDFVLSCVKSVGGEGEIFTKHDFTPDELAEWLNQMGEPDAAAVKVFFNNLPIIKKDFEVSCPSCRSKRLLTLRGLDSFFA